MSTTAELSIIDQLPFESNLEKTFKLNAFLQTPDGDATYNKYMSAYQAFKTVKKIAPFAYVGIMVLALATKFLFSHFMMVVWACVAVYIVFSYFKSNMNRKQRKYLTESMAYAIDLGQKILRVIGGYFYVFEDRQLLAYNDRVCFYVDAIGGELTGYSKESIKKVNIEHVHLGSTTVSRSNTSGMTFSRGSINQNTLKTRGRSTTFSTTNTTENTKVHYEWKIDILTNFLHNPHITLVFPDDKTGEENVKRACALLS